MMSERAKAVKASMSGVLALRQALTAAQEEWRELSQTDGLLGEDLVWQLILEKRALERQLAAAGLKNWVRMRRAGLNDRRQRLLRLRYVKGEPWSVIVTNMGKSKQYLIREHNKALEQMVRTEGKRP